MATDITEVRPAGAQLDTAVPARSRHLGFALVVISMAQLMLVLYAVTFGGLLMLGGRAGDILGRRRMFSVGILFFTLASLLGGFATSSWLLIAARVLQGVGAALAAPAGLSLIAVTFPEGKLRTRALGMYAAMTGLGGGVGVVAGGLLTTYASWRWVFFVNVPIGLLLAFGAPARSYHGHSRVRAAHLRSDSRRNRSRRHLALGRHWHRPGSGRRRRGNHRVRRHRSTVPPAAAALVDLCQPEPDRRLPDPALPGLDLLRHVLLPHPVHAGRVGV